MNRDLYTYYAILGVATDAPPEALKTAFRTRAKLLHPDVQGTGDAFAFQALKKAFDTLSNTDLRRRYDHLSATHQPDKIRRRFTMPLTLKPD